jgi:hypothetical protein
MPGIRISTSALFALASLTDHSVYWNILFVALVLLFWTKCVQHAARRMEYTPQRQRTFFLYKRLSL